jgi:hypothetical protein
VRRIDHLQERRLYSWVAVEVSPHKPTVPRPLSFGIRGSVDPDKSSSTPDESLERRLLAWIEDITGCTEEDDDLIPRQVLIAEKRAVLGGIDAKIMLLTQRFDGCNSGGNRVVAES